MAWFDSAAERMKGRGDHAGRRRYRKEQTGDGDGGGRKKGYEAGGERNPDVRRGGKRRGKDQRGKKREVRRKKKLEDRREAKVIHRCGQQYFCLFVTAVKPISWSGLGNILYFIKLPSAALCLC